jgi:hypothetical protein
MPSGAFSWMQSFCVEVHETTATDEHQVRRSGLL